MSTMDWPKVRAARFHKERPAEWPEEVHGISLEGLSLLGIHEETDKLYWDGKEIVLKQRLRLGKFERCLAILASVGTLLAGLGALGSFVLDLGRARGYWTH